MCCFSGAVQSVTGTNIFARGVDKGRQLLAYSMTLSATDPVAMILPLPVPPGPPENAVRWIDLKGYPDFFKDLKLLFPDPPTRGMRSFGSDESWGNAKPLAVASVGDFEASFVPTLKDFSRLDARFRLADAVWKKLPQYASYGFAVFKLKAGVTNTVHPMAFEFPRRDPKKLFFPTVHVHDGAVHATARFDHSLYLQADEGHPEPIKAWRESEQLAKARVKTDAARALIAPDAHVYLRVLRGELKNEDQLI
jgi:hypothetical protein